MCSSDLVTVTVLPAVKYDPLGSAGGPEDPGVWIPAGQPRKQVDSGLGEFPCTVDDLSVGKKTGFWLRLWRSVTAG